MSKAFILVSVDLSLKLFFFILLEHLFNLSLSSPTFLKHFLNTKVSGAHLFCWIYLNATMVVDRHFLLLRLVFHIAITLPLRGQRAYMAPSVHLLKKTTFITKRKRLYIIYQSTNIRGRLRTPHIRFSAKYTYQYICLGD